MNSSIGRAGAIIAVLLITAGSACAQSKLTPNAQAAVDALRTQRVKANDAAVNLAMQIAKLKRELEAAKKACAPAAVKKTPN